MLHVYDCRIENSTVSKKTLDASGLRLNDFLRVVRKVKKIVPLLIKCADTLLLLKTYSGLN